ncbi:glutathione S-transferase family protein [Parasphingorhabdus sp.]|uniref:glutathione S-transferase family protein n=1 Tax=Parasphingorhabdus sp. TaxID=2709688 RepID=UPI0032660C43
MAEPVVLHSYRYSVYGRIAQMVLIEKDVAFSTVETVPFGDDLSPDYLSMNPFGRVPLLIHSDFQIYETAAIARYVDLAFPGQHLVPSAPKKASRVSQLVSIVDNYCYWPMVRQVCSHRVFRPFFDEPFSEDEISLGMRAAEKALNAIETIANEQLILNGNEITLADCHLAPMVGYFVESPEGAEAITKHKALQKWWELVSKRPSAKVASLNLMTP